MLCIIQRHDIIYVCYVFLESVKLYSESQNIIQLEINIFVLHVKKNLILSLSPRFKGVQLNETGEMEKMKKLNEKIFHNKTIEIHKTA